MNGQQLVNDYQTALVTLSTAQAAQFEASRSEDDLLTHLDAMSSGRFLNPGAINTDDQASITHASLDAHFKKVQAQQIESMSSAQLEQMLVADQQAYSGKKVRISVKSGIKDAIELVTFDQQRGYESHLVRRRTITGIVETVALDRNVLIIKPTLTMRLFNNRLQNYIIYIIDPETLLPIVDLSLG